MTNPLKALLAHPKVSNHLQMIVVVVIVAILGVAALIFARADNALYQSTEAENGSISGCASVVTSSTASNGSAVTFGSCSGH